MTLFLVVGSCDKPLGMESGDIKDDQITFERSYYKSPNEGRLNGNIWCGKYVNGAVRVTIKFKSVVTITSVLFQGYFRHLMAPKVRFRYLDADDAAAGKWLTTRKVIMLFSLYGFERDLREQSDTVSNCENIIYQRLFSSTQSSELGGGSWNVTSS